MRKPGNDRHMNRRDLLKAGATGLATAAVTPTHTFAEGLNKSMATQQTIDVHGHFLPPVYLEALESAGLKLLDGGIPTPSWSPQRALDIMDEIEITGAVLSVSSPHLNFVNNKQAQQLSRAINDYAAEVKSAHPTRFGAYAILPLPDVDVSLAELEHALDDLELDGVALPTHSEGLYLGDKKLTPLLETLNDRACTVFVHPTSPCCFESFGLELPAPMIEFPFDTTRAAASLIYSGALQRFRNINFILPHGGGTLPFLAPRIAAIGSAPFLADRAVPLPDTMQLLAEFYYDTALSVTSTQVNALRDLAPISQILYGTDFPFANEARLRAADAAFIALSLNQQEEQQVRSTNAAPLFPAFHSRCCGAHSARS